MIASFDEQFRGTVQYQYGTRFTEIRIGGENDKTVAEVSGVDIEDVTGLAARHDIETDENTSQSVFHGHFLK